MTRSTTDDLTPTQRLSLLKTSSACISEMGELA